MVDEGVCNGWTRPRWALIGGFVLGLLFDGSAELIMSIVVAFIGAMLRTVVVRKLMAPHRVRHATWGAGDHAP